MGIRLVRSAELREEEIAALRALFDAAWPGDFDETDWQHTVGGVHAILQLDGEIVAHAAVVERRLRVGSRDVRAGYVEAVATRPRLTGRGHGSAVVLAVDRLIRATCELGALSTGAHNFYERLGWLRWRGPTFVRTANALVRTEDEDHGVMVLPTTAFPEPDLDAPIAVDWRPGDAW